jgi:hypothetical protein
MFLEPRAFVPMNIRGVPGRPPKEFATPLSPPNVAFHYAWRDFARRLTGWGGPPSLMR